MLLANIVRVLSEEEIAKVCREFRLPARSMRIFDLIVLESSSPPKSDTLSKKFKISKENLYRLYSELVDETIRILAPKEVFSTLEFYRRRYLFQPFITELRRIEKQLLREKNSAALEQLYEYAFFNSPKFPVSQTNPDITQQYGEKWHRSKKDPPVDDLLFIQLHIIFMRIGSLPSKKKMTLSQMSGYAQALLDPIRKQASHSSNPLVRYQYFQTEWKSCIFDQDDSRKAIEWLRRSLEEVRKHPDKFTSDTEEVIELQIAFELAVNWGKPKEGLEIYRHYYNHQTPETPRGALFLQRFIRIAFIAKEFKTAREILREFSGHQIVRSTPQIHFMAILMKAKLDLIEDSLEDAQEIIGEARKKTTECFFLPVEVQIRALEAILALKQGELELADHLVRRNIKWLHLRRLSLSKSSWIHYYSMIAAIIRYKITREPIRRSVSRHFMNDFRIEEPEFFSLLEPEIPKATPAKKRKHL